MKSKYELHYAPIDLGEEDIKKYEFNERLELLYFIETLIPIKEESDRVYLCNIEKYNPMEDVCREKNIIPFPKSVLKSLNGVVFIDEREDEILSFISSKTAISADKMRIFLFEFEDYKSAYEVAFDMKEISALREID